MKKLLKIKFVDFFDDFDEYNNDFVEILKEYYDIEISSDPDYLFYSCFGFDYLKYNCIRIFFTGECITPNFNECDYAIGFDRLQFGDRYLRMPLYKMFQYRKKYLSLNSRDNVSTIEPQKRFCNFVYSNCFAQDKRTEMFRKLCEYKKVDSGGRYLNNIGGAVKDKLSFQSEYKFSIAFENTSYGGYVTEKIVDAFAAGTVPIYYGDPNVKLDFNSSAFINCHEFENLDAAVEFIKRVDQDDEMYLQIRNENPLCSFEENKNILLEKFLLNIFEQSLGSARRRPASTTAIGKERIFLRHSFYEKYVYSNITRVKNQFSRIKNNTKLSYKRTK